MNFNPFYRDVHGYTPFPWQSKLATNFSRGRYPDITAPTGAGKTSVIDAWYWARQYHSAPTRLVYLIDRRLVVDDVHRHAQRLQAAVGRDSLAVVRLRGGISIEDAWMGDPSKPTVAISTVDQAVSRLLCRGYGCGRSERIVAAALLGNDSLWVVDEAHLSQPAIQTVSTAIKYHRKAVASRPVLIEMTATPHGDRPVLKMTKADRTHRVLGPRLAAHKPSKLVKVSDDEAFRAKCASNVAQFVEDGHKVIGVVVNRVDDARQIAESVTGVTILCLTGLVRQSERDELVDEYLPLIRAGRMSDPDEPIVVVATQTIEVGADLDFDALVTESAPIDALRQRFGRLNRMGNHESSPAVIVARSANVAKFSADRLYGQPHSETWQWLTSDKRKEIDMGLAYLELPEDVGPMLTSRPAAPGFGPQHLDLWHSDETLPVALGVFLHGDEEVRPDVNLLWRDDVDVTMPADELSEVFRIRRPLSAEMMPVPIWRVQRWLGANQIIRVNEDGAAAVSTDDIQPGDTLVAPSRYGGCDRWGWAPNSTEWVPDVGDVCRSVRIKRTVKHLPGVDARLPKVELEERTGSFDWQQYLYPTGLLLVESRTGDISDSGEVTLQDHCRGVSDRVRGLADKLNLPSELVEILATAGLAHDLGKCEPRWQYAIKGGEFCSELIAKSASDAATQLRIREARKMTGLPTGWRHEALSTLLGERLELDDVTLCIIGLHHGRWTMGNPPDNDQPAIESFRVGDWQIDELSSWNLDDVVERHSDRLDALRDQYGYWGVCLLASLLILADWQQSSYERTQSVEEATA